MKIKVEYFPNIEIMDLQKFGKSIINMDYKPF